MLHAEFFPFVGGLIKEKISTLGGAGLIWIIFIGREIKNKDKSNVPYDTLSTLLFLSFIFLSFYFYLYWARDKK